MAVAMTVMVVWSARIVRALRSGRPAPTMVASWRLATASGLRSTDFFSKPVDRERVLVSVRNALARRTLEERVQALARGERRFQDEMLGDFCAMEFLSGKKFTGSVMGALNLRRDLPKYQDMYRKGIIDIDSMLTHRFTLDTLNEAFADAEHGALKNVVVIGGEK